jgi:hypothetical protein
MEKYGEGGYAGYRIDWYADSEDGANMVRIFGPDDEQIAEMLDDDIRTLMLRADAKIDAHIAAYDPTDCEARYQRVTAELAAEIADLKQETALLDALAIKRAKRIQELQDAIDTAVSGIKSCVGRINNPKTAEGNGDPLFDLGEIEGYLTAARNSK